MLPIRLSITFQNFSFGTIECWMSFILAVGMSGCAGMHGKTILNPSDDEKSRGFRYYESSPYLLVQTDNDGGLKSEIIQLPDETKKRSIRPYNFAATISVTLEFNHGVLSHSVADIDETVVPNALITAMETAAKAAIAAANKTTSEKKQTLPGPYLFKIIVRKDSVELVGGQPVVNAEIQFGGDL
jgi:hypothetical protein